MRRRMGTATTTAAAAVLAMLMLPALAGCTPWPEYGTGGLAERQPTESAAVVLLDNRYQALVAAGALRLAAGRMTEANLMLVRARREFAAGLFEDSDHSLAKADAIIASLERDIRPQRARPRAGS